jgi:hypothetical protein
MRQFAIEPTMSRSSPRTGARRPLAAHWAVAGVALVGAAVMQTSWPDAIPSSYRLISIAVILCATAWALSTAWLHWRLRLAATPCRMAGQAVLDLLVAAMAGFILNQGHLSPLALAGLWTIPPVLLALGVPSGVALLTVAWMARHEQGKRSVVTRLRTTIAIALILTLAWMAMRPRPVIASNPVEAPFRSSPPWWIFAGSPSVGVAQACFRPPGIGE